MDKSKFFDSVFANFYFRDGKFYTNKRCTAPIDSTMILGQAVEACVAITKTDLDEEIARRSTAAESDSKDKDKEKREEAEAYIEEMEKKGNRVPMTIDECFARNLTRLGITIRGGGFCNAMRLPLEPEQVVALVSADISDHQARRGRWRLWDYSYGEANPSRDEVYATITSMDLPKCVVNYKRKFRDYTWTNARLTLKHDGSDYLPLMEKLLDLLALDETLPDYRTACRYAIAHWLWMVKRSLFDERTMWELFLIFYGPQGSGKTRLVEKLLSPIEFAVSQKGTEIFRDTRESNVWKALAINFEELANNTNGTSARGYIEETLLANIKEKITCQWITPRVMGGQSQDQFRRSASCIGSTNKELEHHFSDSSGMRRFFVVRSSAPKMDWDAVNAYPWIDLWKSIDENLETGYAGTGEGRSMVDRIQSTYKPWTTVDEWLDSGGQRPLLASQEIKGGDWFSQKESYDIYKDFCVQGRFDSMNYRNFRDAMRSKDIHRKGTNESHHSERWYLVG